MATSSHRNEIWDADGKDPEGMVYTIKAYPMNDYNNPEVMDHVITCVLAARDEVMKGL